MLTQTPKLERTQNPQNRRHTRRRALLGQFSAENRRQNNKKRRGEGALPFLFVATPMMRFEGRENLARKL